MTGTIISAVSRKRHTTRTGVLATHTQNNSQLVFIDTPGFIQPGHKRDEGMLLTLAEGASDSMDRADYTLVIIDAAKRVDEKLREELAILMSAAHASRGRIDDIDIDENGKLVEIVNEESEENRERFAIVLNKVDLVKPKKILLDIADDIGKLGDRCVRYRGEECDPGSDSDAQDTKFTTEEEARLAEQCPPVFYIDSLHNEGIDDILQLLHSYATPTKNFVLGPGQKTDMSMAERVEEIIREKLYRCLHREVPHQITQVNKVLKKGRLKDGRICLRVDQDLIVKSRSHVKLVLGRNGMTIHRIKKSSKSELLKAFSQEGYDAVILNLNVKHSKSQHGRGLELNVSDRMVF